MKRTLNVMTCEGRHQIPQAIDGGIFPMVIRRPTDGEWMMDRAERVLDELGCYSPNYEQFEVNLYVTGFTPATIAIILVCIENKIPLTCWHYDSVTGDYWAQPITDENGEVI